MLGLQTLDAQLSEVASTQDTYGEGLAVRPLRGTSADLDALWNALASTEDLLVAG